MKALTLAFLAVALPVSAQDPSQDDQSVAILVAARARMMRQNDAWFKDGEYLPAIQNLEVLVGTNPHDEESWSNLSWMYMNIERGDLQWITTRRFSRENPTYQDALYYEAEFLYMKKAYAKIPAILEPVIGSGRPDNNVYRFLAHSYTKLGYYKDALRVWDAFIKVNPKDGQAIANRARVADKLAQIKD